MRTKPDPEVVKAIGALVQQARIDRGWQDRAPVAKGADINDRTLGRIETGLNDDKTPYTPHPSSLLKILEYLDLDPAPIFEQLGYQLPKSLSDDDLAARKKKIVRQMHEMLDELARL